MAVETAPPGWMQDWSASGSGKNARVGVLFVHGFTGAPPSMRPWAEYLLAKGYTVRVPLLPGHGTKPQDLNTVKWQEWPFKVQAELEELFKSCDQVFLAGLSMGGGTSLYVAEENNDRLSGVILVNPMIHVPFISAPRWLCTFSFPKTTYKCWQRYQATWNFRAWIRCLAYARNSSTSHYAQKDSSESF